MQRLDQFQPKGIPIFAPRDQSRLRILNKRNHPPEIRAEVRLVSLIPRTEKEKRRIEDETGPSALNTCPLCKTLIKNLLNRDNPDYTVSFRLNDPVIGIGAPISYFLPNAVKPLGAEAILPENADVANAIGAITSRVVIKKQLRIIPGDQGGFILEGIAGARQFTNFDEADQFAKDYLTRMVEKTALIAGTSCQTVLLETHDQIPKTAAGEPIFMGRTLFATLTGHPDIVPSLSRE